MLIKSIKLSNFRQFKDEHEISFSTEKDKNVTIIMGENGAGKTTFAQAFTWCLFGATDFKQESVLNKIVEHNLQSNESITVKVSLNIIHSGIDYTITREQIYKKDATGKVKGNNTIENVSFKKDGQQEFINSLYTSAEIKKIIPSELAKYFFFDGEHIGNMSKDLQKGKSQDFAEAVRGLLGLNAIKTALNHLKSTGKNNVIASYNGSYDTSCDNALLKYNTELDGIQNRLGEISKRFEEIENEKRVASDYCNELRSKLKQNENSISLQTDKEKLIKQVNDLKENYSKSKQAMLKNFNTNAINFFSKSLIYKVMEDLSKEEKIDKGIPHIHADTISFLMKRGSCICGNKIEINNDAYKKLNETLEYIPPQSIGASIKQFIKESELRSQDSTGYFDNIKDNYRTMREYNNSILEKNSRIDSISNQLQGIDDVAEIQKSLMSFERSLRNLDEEDKKLNQEKGALDNRKDTIEGLRIQLTLKDDNNRKIEMYKAYAQYMFNELSNLYKQNEDKIRIKLQEYINDIFQKIYEGGISLTIDDKYNIQVNVNHSNFSSSEIETSTAQNISIIFAFISGIIKMARENNSSDTDENKFLSSEPYPLVMDAPLSAFDKRRIQTVCEVLPKTAEQIIIFIKDTDGEIAEDYMSSVIGKRFTFNKKNEFETIIMPR